MARPKQFGERVNVQVRVPPAIRKGLERKHAALNRIRAHESLSPLTFNEYVLDIFRQHVNGKR